MIQKQHQWARSFHLSLLIKKCTILSLNHLKEKILIFENGFNVSTASLDENKLKLVDTELASQIIGELVNG